jgi:histone H3/H4
MDFQILDIRTRYQEYPSLRTFIRLIGRNSAGERVVADVFGVPFYVYVDQWEHPSWTSEVNENMATSLQYTTHMAPPTTSIPRSIFENCVREQLGSKEPPTITRVSKKAVLFLQNETETFMVELMQAATALSAQQKRKTVLPRDLHEAFLLHSSDHINKVVPDSILSFPSDDPQLDN